MNRFRFVSSVVLSVLISNCAPASADTVKFPCGEGETYSVQMPQGNAVDGRKCSGALVIDDSVKVIGVEAFKDSKVTEIKLPAGLTLISTSAFENTLLKTISIPSSVEIISDSAFAYNNNLKEALIPDSVKSIGAKAFNGTRLTQINIPSSIDKVQSCAFANIDFGDGSRTLFIPSSIKSIEGCAFWNSGITSVSIPNSVTYLAGFSRNKLSTVVIPSSVATIGTNAFSKNPLINVEIPSSVTSIEEWAFQNTFLTDVVIPTSVRVIKDGAFASNLRLKSISIPDKLESLGKNVFEDSPSLQTILYCGELTGFPISTVCPPERKEIIEKEKAEKLAAELKAKQEAEAKAASELKAKQEAEAKAAAAKAAAAAVKKTTITCVKGKLTKKVTAVKPVCPKGYKKK